MAARAKIVIRELTPELWPAVEQLFGPNGACGGCWCMWWRIERGEGWRDIKGDEARRRFRALVASGGAHGLLAFAGEEPVGWCAIERRVDLPRLDRKRNLKIADAERVWSLPCFFIKAGWRGQGVASKLVAAAVKALRARGAEIAEGYPTMPSKKVAAAWIYTGVPSMFEGAGFRRADDRARGMQRWRKKLRARR